MTLAQRLRRNVLGLLLLPALLVWSGSVAFAVHQVTRQALQEAEASAEGAVEWLREEMRRDEGFLRSAARIKRGRGRLPDVSPSSFLPVFFPYAKALLLERPGVERRIWRAEDYAMALNLYNPEAGWPAPGEPVDGPPAPEGRVVPFGEVALCPDPVFPTGSLWYRVPVLYGEEAAFLWVEIPTLARWLTHLESWLRPGAFGLRTLRGETVWGAAGQGRKGPLAVKREALLEGAVWAGAPLAPLDLELRVRRPLGISRTAFLGAVLLGLLFTALVVAVSLHLSQKAFSEVVEGLREMEEAVGALGKGRFSEMTAGAAGGELARFIDAFNRMAADLREFQRERERAVRSEAIAMAFSALAHDLKNGVAHLRLLAENLEKYYDRPGFRQDAVASLRAVVDRLSALLERVSDRGSPPAVVRREPLGEVFRKVEERHRADGLRLELEADDRTRGASVPLPAVEDVLEVLLSNAREAMAREVLCEASSDGEKLTLTVRDDGEGISPGQAQRLFEAFVTSKPKGLGLGLYHARRTLRLLGGDLAYAGGPGPTAFRMDIPLGEDRP